MLILLIPFLKYFEKKIENFQSKDDTSYSPIEKLYLYMSGYSPDYFYRWTEIDYVYVAIIYIMTFLISAAAAYLAFSCTWKGFVTNKIIRAFFAVCAFMLGPIYLVWYFIVNYLGDMC
jgi:hypothetical protein